MSVNHSTTGARSRDPNRQLSNIVTRERLAIRQRLDLPPAAGRYWNRASGRIRHFLLLIENIPAARIRSVARLQWAQLPGSLQRAITRAHQRLLRSLACGGLPDGVQP